MKKRILLLMACVSAAAAQAQTVNDSTQVAAVADSVQIAEVTIAAPHVVSTIDGLRVFPTASQLIHSANAYALLSQLALPQLQVDEVAHSVTVPATLGTVQLRINDVPVTHPQQLQALDIRLVSEVQYIDRPSARYGDDVNFVVNFVVRRATRGYTVGADMTHSLTTMRMDDDVYAKFNSGHGEWQLYYSFDHTDMRGSRYDEQTTYLAANGTHIHVSRHQTASHSLDVGHDLQLRYHVQDDSARHVLQVAATCNFNNRPVNRSEQAVVVPTQSYTAATAVAERSLTPTLDLYYFHRFTPHQTLTANAVGTFIDTRYRYGYTAFQPLAYTVRGRTHSLSAEAIYEHMLQPFTLSAGGNIRQKVTDNRYTGNTDAHAVIRQSDLYLFASLRGTLAQLSYQCGLGLRHLRSHQTDYLSDHWNLQPKLALALPFGPSWRIGYDLQFTQRSSRLASFSSTRVQHNEYEVEQGNPDLRPNTMLEHALSLTRQSDRLYLSLRACQRHHHRPAMRFVEPEPAAPTQPLYLFGWANQRRLGMYYLSAYTRWQALPEHLQLSVSLAAYRFYNDGNDYSHRYTSATATVAARANLGRWTLGAWADSGFRFMENESRGRNEPAWALSCGYRIATACTVNLYWQHCLAPTAAIYRSELLNRHVQQQTLQASTDLGNMLSLNLTWSLDHGRRYHAAERTLHSDDTDTGIVRQ